jgi:RNA polymerase sigma factor (sigma-70 family)
MSHRPLTAVLNHVRRLAADEALAVLPDQELLRRFADRRDESAFAEIVRRHGGMVLGVCRRVLRDAHAAEDAFQAAFLALARRPGAIRSQASLGGWLYRVAYRAAQRARYAAARRQAVERGAPARAGSDPQAELSWREVSEVLDAELQALPDGFRAPLVLCYLEGKTRDEAAQQLGWSVGAFKSRLERGREMLRRRLGRRGVSLGAGLLAGSLAPGTAPALPGRLAAETVRLALSVSAGRAAPPTLLAKVALVLLLGGVTAGAAAWLRGRGTGPPALAAPEKPAEAKVFKAARTDRFGDPLPPHALARLGTLRFRHEWTIYTSAVSPDGRLLAGGGNDAAQVWDSRTGRTLLRLPGHINGVKALAFTPDGKWLASYGWEMKLRITEVATGRGVREFDRKKDALLNNPSTLSYLAFLPGGKQLVLKDGGEPVVRLLDAETGREVRAFTGEGKHLYGMALSPDGKLLAAAEDTGTVRVWEVATGKERLAIKKHKGTDTNTVAFAPGGKTLATGGQDGAARLWDATTGKLLHTLDARAEITVKGVAQKFPLGAVRSLSYSPDGKALVSGHGYWAVFWDPATGKEVRRLPYEGSCGLRFLPDGKTLLVGGDGLSYLNTFDFLDAATGKSRRFDGHTVRLVAVAYSPDGKHVATAGERFSAETRVWDARSGRVVHRLLDARARHGGAHALAFSPKGDVLAAGHGQGILLWDLKTGKVRQTLRGHEHNHMALAYSPDGTRLASGSHDGTVRLWDLAAGGKELRHFRVEKENAWAIAFSPDLRLAASGDQAQNMIHLWDLATGREWKSLRRGGGGSIRLAFSPDGRTLLEGGGISAIFLWEVASGERRRTIATPNFFPWTVVCSPDGRYVAAGGLNPRRRANVADAGVPIHVFDLAGDRPASRLNGHQGTVNALSFSPDGRVLASASDDTTGLVWDIAPGAPAPAARLTPKERGACWDDLGGGAAQTYASIWKLARDEGAVAFLRKELPPAPAPADARVVGRLLAELDSDDFAVRGKAREQLARLGPAAEGQLRKALDGKPSVEVRVSVQKLLDSLERARVRTRRAVEVLELMNTPAARRLLETLAGGAADAWLTREARESLDRLARRRTE